MTKQDAVGRRRAFRTAAIAASALSVLLAVLAPPARAGTAYNGFYSGDLTLQAGDSLVGTVVVGGTLTVPPGVRVVVGSPELSVQAAHIVIAGTVDGTGSGFPGGSPQAAAGGPSPGGTALIACAGGGGAGGVGAGGTGGSPFGPGSTGGPAISATEVPGSGGGAGTSCNGAQGGSGGAGGAAIHLTATDIRISGQVRVDGAAGQSFSNAPFAPPGGGGGGGGAGGDLWLSGQTILGGRLSAAGGNGGTGGSDAGQAAGGGGGGGGGRIHIDGGSLIGEPGGVEGFGGGGGGAPGSPGSPATGGGFGVSGVGATVTPAAVPVASAGGPYSAQPGQTITLDATASYDPAGWPLTYAWDFSGGTGGYADAATARPSFPVDSSVAVGTVDTVCVKVNNGYQDSPGACTTVTVVSRASAPSAKVVPVAQTVENTGGATTVTVDASQSQANGGTLSYHWTSDSGTFADPTAAVASLTIPALPDTALGTVHATVTVDNGFYTSSTTATITIVDTTAPALSLPTALSAPATSGSGAAVTWAATATDTVWTTVTPVCAPASGSTFPIGATTVSCTATDGAGNTASGSFEVTVSRTPATVSIAPVGGKTFGDGPFTVTANGTAGAGDLMITPSGSCALDTTVPSSGSGGTKTVTVDVTSAGTCTLDAAQAAGGAYTAGTAPTLTVPVAKADPQVSWAAPADIVFGAALSGTQLDATTSWPGSWRYTADGATSDATGQVLGAGDHTLTAVFTPADPADINGTTVTVALHVDQAPLTVQASSATMTFGSAPPSVTASYSGFVAGDGPGSLTTPPTCTTDATATSPVGTYASSCAGAAAPNYTVSYLDGGVAVTKAATTLAATTASSVPAGSSLTPSGLLTSSAAACQAGQPVQFSLDRNPLTGVAGSYPLGSGVTDAGGAAAAPTVATTGWQATSYTLTAGYPGTANCSGSSVAAALVVTAPGQVAGGVGSYTIPTVGAVTFGFAVARLPFTLAPVYVGSISLVQDGTWSYQGVISSYVKASASAGTVNGSGTLYWWNPAVNHNHGGWVVARTAVPFTASFTATTRTGPGSFGAQLTYTPVSPQPPALPNSSPAPLNAGAIMVR